MNQPSSSTSKRMVQQRTNEPSQKLRMPTIVAPPNAFRETLVDPYKNTSDNDNIFHYIAD